MALPATDDFTGTNGAQVSARTGWSANVNDCDIQSNAANADASFTEVLIRWSGDTFDNDQYAEGTLAAAAANNYIGPAVRVSTSGAHTCYEYATNNATIYFGKFVAGSYTEFGNASAPSTSTVLRIEAEGTTIRVYQDGGLEDSQTDSGIASGAAGISGYDFNSVTSIDNWEGGNLSTGITEEIGQATETDSALAVTSAKSKAAGLNSETDTALALTGRKTKTIGIATATETALPVTAVKTKAIGLNSETDTALPITREGQQVEIGLATESDAALALTGLKSKAIGLATVTETALPVTALKTKAVGLATEADAAQSVTSAKAKAVGLAGETDTALSVTAGGFTIGLATETDVALPVTALKTRPVGLATETETALAVTAVKSRAIGIATETDAAQAVSAAKVKAIGIATEADTALALVLIALIIGAYGTVNRPNRSGSVFRPDRTGSVISDRQGDS